MLSQMKFGESQWALLGLMVFVAIAIELHRNVKRGSYLGTSLNALMVCIYHLALYKIARNVTPADVLAYLAGWTFGVFSGAVLYRAIWCRAPKPATSGRQKIARTA